MTREIYFDPNKTIRSIAQTFRDDYSGGGPDKNLARLMLTLNEMQASQSYPKLYSVAAMLGSKDNWLATISSCFLWLDGNGYGDSTVNQIRQGQGLPELERVVANVDE